MKTLFFVLFTAIFSFSLNHISAQTHKNHPDKTSVHRKVDKKIRPRYGVASYYAKKFNGRKMTNGEIYRPDKFTAACNVLPLNTWIKVTNLRNHKSVIVKIKDRMNPKNKRLVDLSYAAAKKLGYLSSGLTRVKVEVIHK
ncbi:MAG: septal ring lytic transglycosylase RlpA family protein [Bacteroidota bacterium]|nr:septal ring lytic transglycosylase RlpA family protein [Bacteroidota bacterium]